MSFRFFVVRVQHPPEILSDESGKPQELEPAQHEFSLPESLLNITVFTETPHELQFCINIVAPVFPMINATIRNTDTNDNMILPLFTMGKYIV